MDGSQIWRCWRVEERHTLINAEEKRIYILYYNIIFLLKNIIDIRIKEIMHQGAIKQSLYTSQTALDLLDIGFTIQNLYQVEEVGHG